MTPLHRFLALGATFGLALLTLPVFGSAFPDDDDLPPPKFSVETRGPIHEAFAQPNEGKPVLFQPIPKEPPPAVPERPPEQKPDNPNLEWIPGYWSWDGDRNDFVWVSGTFRDPPPGRRWVPGHWANGNSGWSWVPGFWAGENQPELKYTPEPPAPIEAGPSQPAPDENSGYVPGYWQYNDAEQRFAWRPGYYAPYRDGRVWISPQYYWTPRGYVFVDGYWDFPLENRGLLFAPAYFPTPLWNDPDWFYQPSYVVPTGLFLNAGFYGPGFGSFYFGNYYGNGYFGRGYRPWWNGPRNQLYNYYAWNNRNNPQWGQQQRQNFANRLNGTAPLPPANLSQQRAQLRAAGANANAANGVTPLNRFTPQNGKIVPNANVAANNLQAQNVQGLAKMRSNVEGKSFAAKTGAAGAQPASLRLPPAPPNVRPLGAPSSASLAGIPTTPYTPAANKAFSSVAPSPNAPTPNFGNQPRANNPSAQPGAPRVANVPQPSVAPRPVPNPPAIVNNPPRFNGPTQQTSPVVPRLVTPPQTANVPQPSVATRPVPNSPTIVNNPPRFGGPTQQPGPVVPRPVTPPQATNIPRPSVAPLSTPQFRSTPPAAAPAVRNIPSPAPAVRSAPPAPTRSFSPPAASRPSVGSAPRPGGGSPGGGARTGGGGGGRPGGGGGGKR